MARQLIVLCVCLFQIVSGQPLSDDDKCETVDKDPGVCLNLKLCKPYINILIKRGPRPAVQDFLRRSQCGFDGNTPKVCCPVQSPRQITTEPPQPPTTTSPLRRSTADAAPDRDVRQSSVTDETDYISEFPAPPQCGVSKGGFHRVVGGVDAKLGDLPWMALLGYRDRESPRSWRCGGSLISHRHVLTAAHCIYNQLYVVRLGELDLAREDEGATPIDVLIKSMIKHEQYDPTSAENDIGLLVLQNDVQYSELIRPICIPAATRLRSYDFVDWMPFLAGWGATISYGAGATHLQVLQLPVISKNDCMQKFKRNKDRVIDERVICAGYNEGGKDSCSGDSGGPLMQPIPENWTTYFYQIGVVSYGSRQCGQPGRPGIYARVTNYIPWLRRHVIGTR